ncbi:hypothetical protein [Roseococcus thiosulfatophilus]|uniref:hypothetical protein n=1 Tax=Roseococcus thiosulfatophilus TaxID=35813 RepID=UPI001A8CF321|nr:hypothetical protein [Roseococcus thiosulfatophilus]
MPFAPTALTPVFQSQSFSLWHYRSTDTRDQITTVGYFAPARTQLRVGDVIIAQASDALSILPVRSNATIGTGVNLDGAIAPIALTRTVAKSFQFVQQASAVVTTIILAPLLAGLIAGTSIPVSAQVLGPISQVVVSIRDAQGQLVPPAQIVDVSQGYVTTTLPTPPVGTGYRLRVEDAGDSGVAAISSSFNILPDLRLILTEAGVKLLQEDGSAIAQG